MADKVQFVLEDVLDEAAYLVRKGIFSQGELQQQMKKRQAMEHALVNSTHRAIDHLKAIEFEYQVERIRRYRQECCSEQLDPRFRKANTKDFSVVKRIIRLWDRTMYRYRYRIDLWKEYLAFCYVVKSRRTFYKALSNAVKFNPFELELWLSGVYYEVEANNNPWKARKVFHKALKTNRANRRFWQEYLRFELTFAQIILERQQKLIGSSGKTEIIAEGGAALEEVDPNDEQGDEKEIEKELIGEDESQQNPQTESINFIGLIKTVIEEALAALPSEDEKIALAREMIGILGLDTWSELLQPTIEQIRQHLQQLIVEEKIVTMTKEEQYQSLIAINYRKQYRKLKQSISAGKSLIANLERVSFFKLPEREQLLRATSAKSMDSNEKAVYFLSWATLMADAGRIDDTVVTEALRELSLHRKELTEFIQKVINVDPLLLFKKLINSKLNFPAEAATYYLQNAEKLKLPQMDINGVLHRVNQQEAFSNKSFVCALAIYNKRLGLNKANLELVQKLNRSVGTDKSLVTNVVSIMNG